MGFSTRDVKKVEDGYLVEGDIVITDENLTTTPDHQLIRVGAEEQYRTTFRVTVPGASRTISIRVSFTLPAAYVTATDEAIRRYNALGLRLRFTRVTSGGDIVLSKAASDTDYLAVAGFPVFGGSASWIPYHSIRVNSDAIGTANPSTYIATILAHEIGHCIGFRHTDYADRSYSCGGQTVNEGATSVGALHIPGTPVGPDPNSWMLACIGVGVDRPFNANDITALRYVY
jgi:hypothetical protein